MALRFYPVTSADGTRLAAWTNDADGPTVLLCNGLGTSPYAWPPFTTLAGDSYPARSERGVARCQCLAGA